jgi:chemotaxis protein methyltransferase CheR
MTARPFQPQVFAILADLLERRFGIHYGPNDAIIVWDKVAARAAELGFESLLDYYYLLRYDDPHGTELQALAEAVVVHETYFFRELVQLRLLVDHLVPEALARGVRPRIWSAACSTGEEPTTIAMLLAEKGFLDQVELMASDVSERALRRARSGAYSPRSLREGAPAAIASRHLDTSGPAPRVAPEILASIRFSRLNLRDAAAIAAMGQFDVILCRNVLIYFSDAAIRATIDALTSALRPEGVLFVGVSESLLRLGVPLTCEERGGVFYYRKSA